MADSFTGNLNLRKPEVGHANDTWGGTAGLNADLDLLDSVFQSNGLSPVAPVTGPLAGVPGVGLRIGIGYWLNIEGGIAIKDHTDVTKVALFDSSLISTGQNRTFQFPDQSGVIATVDMIQRAFPPGTILSGYYGGTPPPGFVFLDGRTIGDASSGATNRANADTVNLFTLFWNLGGIPSGGRGSSAASDFAAHKTMTLLDHSGRVMAGRDDLSGTSRNVLAPGMGTSTVRGGIGGIATDAAQSLSVTGISGNVRVAGTITSTSTGMDTADTTIQTLAGPAGNNAAAPGHRHANVNSTSGPITLDGTILAGATGSATTTIVTNVQPTICVDVVIAL